MCSRANLHSPQRVYRSLCLVTTSKTFWRVFLPLHLHSLESFSAMIEKNRPEIIWMHVVKGQRTPLDYTQVMRKMKRILKTLEKKLLFYGEFSSKQAWFKKASVQRKTWNGSGYCCMFILCGFENKLGYLWARAISFTAEAVCEKPQETKMVSCRQASAGEKTLISHKAKILEADWHIRCIVPGNLVLSPLPTLQC